MMMNKGPFYYWSKKGNKQTGMIETWREYYNNLSATYLQQGMHREAQVFEEAAEEFQRLEQELEEVLRQRAASASAACAAAK